MRRKAVKRRGMEQSDMGFGMQVFRDNGRLARLCYKKPGKPWVTKEFNVDALAVMTCPYGHQFGDLPFMKTGQCGAPCPQGVSQACMTQALLQDSSSTT
jgi:hypothetical protein